MLWCRREGVRLAMVQDMKAMRSQKCVVGAVCRVAMRHGAALQNV